ncbi:Universal stress protein [Paragonimus heterotremus]|uniref:Universal stress protein n=1 Tax=Paragonimus heterotremus TaxID=100268 RepID=A0A8J4SFV8_9TREM|nr:Universal stress protein [Paragonimus heterotremus]
MSGNHQDDSTEAKRKVIIPLDTSPHSKRAMEWYFVHMKSEHDLLLFVHIVEPIRNRSVIGAALEKAPVLLGTTIRISENFVREGKRLCREAMQEASEHGIKAHSFIYLDTKPGAALVKAINELNADIVVMGNRGVGPLRRTILGSVSNYVLHHARLPIALVPPPLKNSIE